MDELENDALDVNEILECKIAQDSVVKCPEPVTKSQYVSFEFPIRKENKSFVCLNGIAMLHHRLRILKIFCLL